MATNAEKLVELRAELVAIKAALTRTMAAGQSSSIDGMSVSRVNINYLREERTRIEKSIQRLLNGGRGIIVDMSYPASEQSTNGDAA
jgi:hypothetical protein